jgi:hypothetical protein
MEKMRVPLNAALKDELEIPAIWRAIPSEPSFEASDTGQVRNRFTGRLNRVHLQGRYWRVNLPLGKKPYLHKLICEAFYGAPPFQHARTLFRDGNRANLSPSNLGWYTLPARTAGRMTGRLSQAWKDKKKRDQKADNKRVDVPAPPNPA